MSEHQDICSNEQAVSSLDCAALFACLQSYRYVLLAVSGGSDSVALLHLVAQWAKTVDYPPVIEVATVDHGLRSGSDQEAIWVARLASDLGLTHHTRQWSGEKPSAGVQDAARVARYNLMIDVVRERAPTGRRAIVTAHTEDDQAETVLMRLARGSGVAGLSAMPPCRMLNSSGNDEVELVRPFLSVAKLELQGVLTNLNQGWLEDPSNEDSERFERIRIRSALDGLAKIDISKSRIAESARRLGRAHEALTALTHHFINDAVTVTAGAMASVPVARFDAQPCELQIRILQNVLDAFGGAALPARLSQIENLVAKLASPPLSAGKFTLGGCVIEATDVAILVYRESGRSGLADLILAPGQTSMWDNRFAVTWQVTPVRAEPDEMSALQQCTGQASGAGTPETLTVRAFGGNALGALRHQSHRLPQNSGLSTLPLAAAQTLPSFWYHDVLIAVPSLNIGQQFLSDCHADEGQQTDAQQGEGGQTQKVRGDRANLVRHWPCRVHCQARFTGLERCQFETSSQLFV